MAILNSVWQKLTGLSSLNKAPASFAEAQEHANATHLASSVADVWQMSTVANEHMPDLYLPLWDLLKQRQIIEVKVESSTLAYQTIILAIDIQRGLLWLDDLFPSQHLLEVGDRITLRHHRNGEQLSFTAPILAWGSTYGAGGFAITLPEHLCYAPRRQFRRAHISGSHSFGLKIRPIGQSISYGNVLDLSSGGLRASIPGNLLGQLRHGALLPLCELNLSDELTIRCSARVRSFRLLRSPYRHTQISMEFIDLPAERVQQLQQFINNLIYLQQTEGTQELRSA